MGTFRVDIEIENLARPGQTRLLQSVLVDTGARLSWVPAEILESLGVERNNLWHFRQADGTVLERWTGTVAVTVAGKRTADELLRGGGSVASSLAKAQRARELPAAVRMANMLVG